MFTKDLWEEWLSSELKNYKLEDGRKKFLKKGYTHFDHRIWLPLHYSKIKNLLQNNLKEKNVHTGKMQWHAFTPFIKLLLKTPRFRYQEEERHYNLECKIRPICFASHFDSLIFSFYSYALNKKYQQYIIDKEFGDCVLAYRSDTGKCNIQYSKEIFDQIKRFNTVYGKCTVIALDIKSYFDCIDHATLKQKWIKVWGIGDKLPDDQFKVFEALTRYSYVGRKSLYKKYKVNVRELKRHDLFPSTLFDLVPGSSIREKYDRLRSDRIIVDNRVSSRNPSPKGIPQGSSMSALLSNLYLIDYDESMSKLAQDQGFVYRRYCDDIILVCRQDVANDLKRIAINEVKDKYHLTIQEAKAEIIDFQPNSKGNIRSFRRKRDNLKLPILPSSSNERSLYKNLQYLGFEFNGKETFIRCSSVSRYFRKMKARVDRSVKMAYSPKGEGEKIFRFQIYERYTHFGSQNFITYAKKSAKAWYKNHEGIWREGHNSNAILKQVSRHMNILNESLNTKSMRRYCQKRAKGKNIDLKL